jgi:hypothetical protein
VLVIGEVMLHLLFQVREKRTLPTIVPTLDLKPVGGEGSMNRGNNLNMSKYILFSTGSKSIRREGYDQWVQPAGRYDDGKEYYNCMACGLYKSFHRPEFCPALKTNSKYANGLWRESTWDNSPGADCCRQDYPGLGFAPKNDEMGNPIFPKWWIERKERATKASPRRESRSPGRGEKDMSVYGPQVSPMGDNTETRQRSRRRDKNNRDSSGQESDNQSTGDYSQGTIDECDWVVSELNSLNSDCVTDLRILILNSNSTSLQDNTPDILESEGVKELIKPTLLDTGARLSYVSLSFASRLEKEFKGIRGKGKYKVIDPFQKAHYFCNDISFKIGLNTGDPVIDKNLG